MSVGEGWVTFSPIVRSDIVHVGPCPATNHGRTFLAHLPSVAAKRARIKVPLGGPLEHVSQCIIEPPRVWFLAGRFLRVVAASLNSVRRAPGILAEVAFIVAEAVACRAARAARGSDRFRGETGMGGSVAESDRGDGVADFFQLLVDAGLGEAVFPTALLEAVPARGLQIGRGVGRSAGDRVSGTSGAFGAWRRRR